MEQNDNALARLIDQAKRLLSHPDAEWIESSLIAVVLTMVRKELNENEVTPDKAVEFIQASRLCDYTRKSIDYHRAAFMANYNGGGYIELICQAMSRVPISRFIFPRLNMLGRILKLSEFEVSGTTLWNMWVQLLARTCDLNTQMNVHPSYPWLLSQLSESEAIVLSVARDNQQSYDKIVESKGRTDLLNKINGLVMKSIPGCDNSHIMDCIDHIEMLGMIYFFDYKPGDDQHVFYILPRDYMDGHISFNNYGLRFLQITLDEQIINRK